MVFLEVTNRCNLLCTFCPQGISTRPSEHMETDLAKSLIRQLFEAGYENALYFHLLGEPLLHPDVFEIVGFASERLPEAILFTNGSLLTDKNIESAFDARPHELVISMQLVGEQSFKSRRFSMGWDQYVSRIRNTVQYKLTHDAQTLLRISVGMRKENSIYPHEDYFPHVTPIELRESVVKLFSGIPGLDSERVQEKINSVEIPFEGSLELAPGVSVSIKPMGNWRRIYMDEKVEKGHCPHVGKEFGILSNCNVVLCHLDYDGRTTFGNVKDGRLLSVLQNSQIQREVAKFHSEGTVPRGCQYCSVAGRYKK